MTKSLKFTPAKPCCDGCVLEAMTIAGFDYTQPFVVLSGVANQPKRGRAALLEPILASGKDIFVIVSAPLPKTEESEKPAEAAAEEDSAIGETTLREILGIPTEKA